MLQNSARPMSTERWGFILSLHTLFLARITDNSSSPIKTNWWEYFFLVQPHIRPSYLFLSPSKPIVLIRNDANDPKKQEKECASMWVLVYVYWQAYSKINPTCNEKLLLLLLHFLSQERKERWKREEDKGLDHRVDALKATWEKDELSQKKTKKNPSRFD